MTSPTTMTTPPTTTGTPGPPNPPPDVPTSRATRSRLAPWLWLLALAMLVAAALVGWLVVRPASQLASQRDSDAAAVAAARQVATNYTTLDYRSISAYNSRMLDSATSPLKEQLAANQAKLGQLVVANKAVARPTRIEVALVSADADSAEVIAGVAATQTNAASPSGQTKTYRLDLKMTKVSGEWKVSDLVFVS